MPVSFRKSKKVAPGLRVNVGKGGVSLSAGGKRAGVNVGKRGLTGRVSAPGTGLGYRTKARGCMVLVVPAGIGLLAAWRLLLL